MMGTSRLVADADGGDQHDEDLLRRVGRRRDRVGGEHGKRDMRFGKRVVCSSDVAIGVPTTACFNVSNTVA